MKAIIKFAGLLAVTGMLGGAAVDANAATSQNINSHGAICNPESGPYATYINNYPNGVWNAASFAIGVVCAVPRHPVTGPGQSFYIDGDNYGGQTTYFYLYSYSFTGNLESYDASSSNLAHYDLLRTLSSVGFFSYVSLYVPLPARQNGVFRGVTALDN